MVIDTVGGSLLTVTSRWSSVWFAAEQAVAKCVRQGKEGHIPIAATIPGRASDTERFRVTITDEPGNVALPGANNGTVQEIGAVDTA